MKQTERKKDDDPPDAAKAGFEEMDHTADAALRVWGPDLEALLGQAALGLAGVMAGPIPRGPFPVRKELTLEAFDPESLLVEWLGELAVAAETDRVLFYEFDFTHISDRRLTAVIHGKQVRELETVVKAVTYHNLKIVDTGRGLETTVVFDV